MERGNVPGDQMAEAITGHFTAIDGTALDMGQWAGQPVLLVNTASKCGFTRQYDKLQALHETYQDRGLVVLAVPSDDFRQELANGAAVQAFCETKFGLTIPMADITPVKGPSAHPVYQAIKAQSGFEPKWNFNKVLIGRDGTVKGSWGSMTEPNSDKITRAIEAELSA